MCPSNYSLHLLAVSHGLYGQAKSNMKSEEGPNSYPPSLGGRYCPFVSDQFDPFGASRPSKSVLNDLDLKRCFKKTNNKHSL